jgi:ubiquinone/menaquinone biosynthesis C-methylase UbiE
MDAKKIQEEYYKKTYTNYDEKHLFEKDEHHLALSHLIGVLNFYNINSILDVGTGTGRALKMIKDKSSVRVMGIEIVKELREVAYKKGITREELIEGDILNIPFEDNSFDLVCEFGVLHHVKDNKKAVDEMLRVSKKAIFLSDTNNFGQGSFLVRSTKQLLNSFKLWKLFNFIRTFGKGYMVSAGDGLFYSYSVFDNYKQIKKSCKSIHMFNTTNSAGINLYRNASHVTLLGIKSS